jgi:hypothetical protein
MLLTICPPTVAGALVGVGLARYLSGVVTSATSATGALISAAKSEVALAVAQDKAAQSAVAASGLKFIGLSKLYRDREAQMFRLLSKKNCGGRSKSHCSPSRLTTALASGTATEKSGPELHLSVQAGLVAAKMPTLRLSQKGVWPLRLL